MSITTERIAKANGIGRTPGSPAAAASAYLFDAVKRALDCLITGVIVVGDQGRILHSNLAAHEMLEAKSPIIQLGGCLCALQAERTKELRRAIATAQADGAAIGPAGLSVALLDKTGRHATAHVLPLTPLLRTCRRNVHMPVVVFILSSTVAPPIEIGAVVQSFHLTPVEARLLQQLVSGASLHEANLTPALCEIGTLALLAVSR
jgi:hypothetical protein